MEYDTRYDLQGCMNEASHEISVSCELVWVYAFITIPYSRSRFTQYTCMHKWIRLISRSSAPIADDKFSHLTHVWPNEYGLWVVDPITRPEVTLTT